MGSSVRVYVKSSCAMSSSFSNKLEIASFASFMPISNRRMLTSMGTSFKKGQG